MSAMSETAAAWFRRARLRAGFRSQAQLARTLGLARAAIANWESESVRGRPSRSILPHLAQLLGVSPAELAARFGIDPGHSVAMPPLDPAVLAAIEEAVALGVARGLREVFGAPGEAGESKPARARAAVLPASDTSEDESGPFEEPGHLGE